MNPIFTAKVEKNRLVFDEPDNLSLWLGQFIEKTVEVIIRKKLKIRSTGKQDEEGNQNGYYWSVVIPLSAKELGYQMNEMHEIFTQQFAPTICKTFGKTNVQVKIRSSEMNTFQFTEYVEAIRQTMAEMGVLIPDPQKIL